MARNPDALIPKNFRLPPSQVEFIKGLAKRGVFGAKDNESDAVRALLQRAIDGLIEGAYVQKHYDALKALKDGPSPASSVHEP
jgi:Arc/MetJ-type ribon-helix-helix transcriptional regulator